jgi:hypothetical protein
MGVHFSYLLNNKYHSNNSITIAENKFIHYTFYYWTHNMSLIIIILLSLVTYIYTILALHEK